MPDDRMKKIEKIFDGALQRSAAERAAFLDRACGDDDNLRREVEGLLAADSRAGEFLEQPIAEHGIELRPQGSAPGGELVGAYRLLRRIGEGGMSEVYLAVRADDEYQKRVALKIIRQDLDREDMLRRFRTERQILAGLDHPNIAKLLDGGTTEGGLPYFVMDYIEGVPVDQYCDRGKLTLRERLELFRSVCSAVQYAHQNLVVHRDIKASNILVTSDGVPKLLDFGIAKLVKPDQFAQQAEYTATWLRPMTPRYASPEQVQGKLVTTASDVYSLGVLLYHLLTGHFPYRLEGRPPTELARLVVEEQPEKPSTAITRVETDPRARTREPVSADVVSKARRTQPPQLRRQLAGDLDNIVLMALRKEPQRRYASVEQFAEDTRRYLRGLPVLARQDTLGYRTSKFLRRNWLGVAVATGFVLLLVGFALTMVVQANRIAPVGGRRGEHYRSRNSRARCATHCPGTRGRAGNPGDVAGFHR
jgi:serine/threonine protein kinase